MRKPKGMYDSATLKDIIQLHDLVIEGFDTAYSTAWTGLRRPATTVKEVRECNSIQVICESVSNLRKILFSDEYIRGNGAYSIWKQPIPTKVSTP